MDPPHRENPASRPSGRAVGARPARLRRMHHRGPAERHGLAKTTIYRLWPTKLPLIADALGTLNEQPQPQPATGTPRQIEQLLEHLPSAFSDSTSSACIPALIEAAEHHPEVAEFVHRYSGNRPDPLAPARQLAIQVLGPPSSALPLSAPVSGQPPLAATGQILRRRLADAQTYWLATTAPDGRPHVRPVLGAWVGGSLHTTSSPTARKARNLALNDRCSFSVSADAVDVVLEGTAEKVVDSAHCNASPMRTPRSTGGRRPSRMVHSTRRTALRPPVRRPTRCTRSRRAQRSHQDSLEACPGQ